MKQSLLLLILKGELENTSKKKKKKKSIGNLQLHEILKVLDWRGILVLRHIVIFLSALDSPSIYHW